MQIVYATDGSPGALAAGEFLARLPLTREDLIVVLTVGADQPEATPLRSVLDGTSATIETERRQGSAADQILECARERSADLIAVGAMGVTGLARFFIGSTAERVLRHADRCVLVGRPLRFGLKRVLMGVDKSEIGKRVVEAVARFPVPPETELMLATVLPPREALLAASPVLWSSLAGELEAILNAAYEEAEERLRALARELQQQDKKVAAEVLRGDPATALLEQTDAQQADLVVVGSHGEGGVDRFLLGSVSERLSRHARCSVLVVR
jgi:nucleotide-binding universal stress UspA family protein